MDARLSKLVAEYQERVAEAVAMLEAAGLHRPSSNREWALRSVPWSGTLPGGFKYAKHGYGCAVDGPEWRVDFDFGADGQINGFDAFRLRDFARMRLTDYGFATEDEIDHAVEKAAEAGDLVYSGYILYYPSTETD